VDQGEGMVVVLLKGRGPRRRVLLDGRKAAFGVLTPKTKRLACPHQTPLPRDLIEFHESPRLPSGAFAVLGLIQLGHWVSPRRAAPRAARAVWQEGGWDESVRRQRARHAPKPDKQTLRGDSLVLLRIENRGLAALRGDHRFASGAGLALRQL
jgi:hypothetical protein